MKAALKVGIMHVKVPLERSLFSAGKLFYSPHTEDCFLFQNQHRVFISTEKGEASRLSRFCFFLSFSFHFVFLMCVDVQIVVKAVVPCLRSETPRLYISFLVGTGC